ncbi:MAG: acyl carrier protein [Paraglaciecola sp.]|jgi:acyl carrier protein
MSTSDIKTSLCRLILHIAPEADIDSLDPSADMRDELDLDSMDFLRLLTSIDKKMQVNIPESDYGQVNSLQALTEYIAKRHPEVSENNP